MAHTVSSTPAINRLPWASAKATMPSEMDAKAVTQKAKAMISGSR